MRLIALLLAGACLWVYQSVWSAQWVFEDVRWVGSSVGSLTPRGLAAWTWTWTLTPAAAHAMSLGLHLLNGALVGWLARRLGCREGIALLLAAVWWLHPGHVESVAYAASRTELIAGTGVLGACLWATTTVRWWWVGAVACGLVALGGKESAVVLLGLVPVTRWVLGRPVWMVGSVAISLAAVLPVLWGGWGYVVALGQPTVEPLAPEDLALGAAYAVGGWSWVLVQSQAIVRVLGVLLGTGTTTLDADYTSLTVLGGLGAVGVLLAMGVAAWRLRHTAPLVAYGLGWWLVAIAPRLLVRTPTTLFPEHQAYIPAFGVFLAVAASYDALRGRVSGAVRPVGV